MSIKKLLKLKTELLFDPESPGVRLWVTRSWIGRMFKPTDFATLGESIRSSSAILKDRRAKANALCY